MKYKTQLVTKVYDAISAPYAKLFKEPSDHINPFLKLVSKDGKILDAGCGPGVDSGYMASKGFIVIGVDLSEKMLAIARKKNPEVDFQEMDIRKLNFKSNTFDGIIASFSLTYIPKKDVEKTIANFYKLLKPNGVIHIGIQEGKSEEIFLTEPLKPNEKMFLNVISEDEIMSILQNLGFVILEEFSRPPENEEEFNFKKFVVIAKKKK